MRVFVLAQGVRLGGLGCITSLYVAPHAPLLHASFPSDSLHDAFSVSVTALALRYLHLIRKVQ